MSSPVNTLKETLTAMDFDYLSSGQHSMSVEGMRKALGNDHFLFLDVRTDKECAYLTLPFAVHIPLNELPARLNELPRDKCIVTLCGSIFRAAAAWTYLSAEGFDEVKCLAAMLEDVISAFKPGPLAKM